MNTAGNKANILLVDDEPENLLALGMLVEGADRRLMRAHCAADALRCAHEHDLALILVDLCLPGTDAIELARRLRTHERSRFTPIIFLTSAADELAPALRGHAVGAVDYLVKPVMPEVLRSKVSVFIELYLKSASLCREVVAHQRAEEKVRESEERLRALASHVIALREEERAEIAREIHDALGQALTALKMDIAWLAKHLSEPALLVKTESMCLLVDDTVRTVRRIASGLRPEVLDDMGLVAAIAWQTTEFQKRTGLRCRTTLQPNTAAVDKERSTTLFRIYQEILTNVARHARATRLDVTLRRSLDQLVLEVADNGIGIALHDANDRAALGLLGMRERALRWGGTVEISGVRGIGTRVVVSIPTPFPDAFAAPVPASPTAPIVAPTPRARPVPAGSGRT